MSGAEPAELGPGLGSRLAGMCWAGARTMERGLRGASFPSQPPALLLLEARPPSLPPEEAAAWLLWNRLWALQGNPQPHQPDKKDSSCLTHREPWMEGKHLARILR